MPEPRTTDTVATDTLAQHQISSIHGGTIVRGYRCTCGQMGSEAWGPLHLVEMGVEAGVTAMAELRAAQDAEDARELTTLELAERDLAGWLHGMMTSGRGPDADAWRDALALLVHAAATPDEPMTTARATAVGGALWVELEAWETAQDHMDGRDPLRTVPVVACWRTDAHGRHSWRAEPTRELVDCLGR